MTALKFVPGGEWEILWHSARVLRNSVSHKSGENIEVAQAQCADGG